MEGRSAHVAIMHSRDGNACTEVDGVEIWNSGLTSKPLADTCHGFWANKGFSLPAHITTVDNGCGAIQIPQLIQIAKKSPAYAPNHLLFPSTMLQGSSFPKEASLSSFFPALNGVGEMGLHKPMGHILESPQVYTSKVDVQLSEGCQRRFVMFDRCGSKRRMIFHPSLMKECPALLSAGLPPRTGACTLDSLPEKALGQRNPALVVPPFLSASAIPVGLTFPNYNSHPLLQTAFMDSHSSASDNCDKPISSSRGDVETKGGQGGDGAPQLSCFSHENTEDLEALLSSDEDEVSSTGHSPSDVTRNMLPLDNRSDTGGHGTRFSWKRKNRDEDYMDDGDTCSTATSGLKMYEEVQCQSVRVTGTNASCGKESFVTPRKAALAEDLGYGNMGLTAFDMCFADEVSSSSSANNPKRDNNMPSMQQQADGISRKEKIKNILRHLRGIIPGGESMDTTFVLDEAIQYVKTLQSEVQKLQARKPT